MFKIGCFNDTIFNTIQRHFNSIYEIQLAFLMEDQLDDMFQNNFHIYILVNSAHLENKRGKGGLVKIR